jgi:hypothetical protein
MAHKFDGYDIEFKKMKLRDANDIFPYVASAMTKIAIGNFDFFKDVSPSVIEIFQEKTCMYSLKVSKKSDGEIVKKNLTLSDLDAHIQGIIPLIMSFLEFQFGFFSQAPKILTSMTNGFASKEKDDKEA